MTGNGRHRVAISAATVPVIGPSVCVSRVWVVARPSEADGCVPSSDRIDLSGHVPPPPLVERHKFLSYHCRLLGSF